MKLIIVLICSAVILGSCFSQSVKRPRSNEARILGGSIVKTNPPYNVGIHVIKGLFTTFWCSGALITEKIGLTTAHCLHSGSRAIIFVGSVNKAEGKSYEITKYNWVIHEKYEPIRHDNDIAMFWLPESITLSPTVNFVKPGNAEPNDVGKVSGWGYAYKGQTRQPTKLLYAIVKVMPHETCAKYLNITENQMCTTSTSHRASTYSGDVGAPFIFKDRIVGLNSIGLGNCSTSCPDVYTKICSYIDWINLTGALSEEFC